MLHTRLTQSTVVEDPDLHRIAPLSQVPSNEESNSNAGGETVLGQQNANANTVAQSSGDPNDALDLDGTWGERDIGGPVNQRLAMDDYHNLRREISHLSNRRSRSIGRDHEGSILRRTATGRSRKSEAASAIAEQNHGDRRPSHMTSGRTDTSASAATNPGADARGNGTGAEAETHVEFDLDPFIREGHFEKRTSEGKSAKKVGVVYRNLTIKGAGSSATHAKTLPDAVIGTFGPDLYRLLCRFVPFLRFNRGPPTRTLINDFTGLVRDGEMMLVLGRPGSGCTSFLKAIANKRDEYAAVLGDVNYGGISAEQQNAHYRGEVNYNPEDDQHLPTLDVRQTLAFSLMNKTRKREKGEIAIIIDALLKMFGITHTAQTLVGNEMVRGISGGERKRVSIAETLATKSTVVCWDNSTRGLDASTALDYARSLRIMTDVSNRTTLVTLYQAGEGIYDLMDKVLVIDAGRMLYQGPAKDAKQYFLDLGFECPDRETTADFLTAVTDPVQRRFRAGYEASAPKSPEDFERAFRASEQYKRVLAEVTEYEDHLGKTEYGDAKMFRQSVKDSQSKRVSEKSSFTVSFWRQILTCTQREFWLVWGDKPTLYTKYFIIISNGLIVASLFYGASNDTSGAFAKGGLAFFSIVFLGWLQLSELIKALSGRIIIQRHKDYAFYRPSAVCLARVLADLPQIFCMCVPFTLIMYFLGGLDVNVSKFFIYFLFVYLSTLNLTALYRMFAALSPSIDDAVRFSGVALTVLVVFTGYVIAKPIMLGQKIWFGWIYYINPIAYAFEAVLTNEFHKRVMPCAQTQLIPQGPNARPPYQGCAFTGAQFGQRIVTGEQYLETAFQYSRAHLWRNLGVLIAFTVLYILVTAIASEVFSFAGGGGGALIFKKGAKAIVPASTKSVDEEKGGHSGDSSASSGNLQATSSSEDDIHKVKTDIDSPNSAENDAIFTWCHVNYSVPYGNGERQLLTSVHGYAKPGVMVALMGASGAGKTTLLNTLSQRQVMGKVSGKFLVDGKPLGQEFQRVTGFVEQMDLHDGTATIREAIEFSALLRQERHVPRAEKLSYVEEIIDLLELREIQDVLIMSLGVEQRKRVTIAVELAAKPSMLFLDEPTSGLDSQSAFSIVRFLKKLARAGHAIICTIHQPSSLLIQQFDMILALNPGGQTFYFGTVGENGSDVAAYFAERGVKCPPHKNIAEFILETAAKGGRQANGKRLNWNDEWRDSEQNKKLVREIEVLNAERAKTPARKDARLEHAFASPLYLQCITLTQRMFRQHWRDPSYLYGKLFVSVIVGIFNGFTFWRLGHTVADLQNRMFTAFLILLLPAVIVNAVVPKFYTNMALWLGRENPSRIYNWFAFCTASVITEIPIAIISSILYWLLWYYPTGLARDSSTAGYVFFITMLFFLFQASWGQWICAFAPSFTVISNVLPFFFVVFALFNGVVKPYMQLNVFWRYWLYYLNPSTYWIGGVLAATMRDVPIQCADSETAKFDAPMGQTCEEYAGSFVQQVGQGYLTNPQASSRCGFCQYSSGVEYMHSLNVNPSDKWKYLPIFLAFCISNYALVYFFIWTIRVKGFGFGMGYLSRGLGLLISPVQRIIGRLFSRRR